MLNWPETGHSEHWQKLIRSGTKVLCSDRPVSLLQWITLNRWVTLVEQSLTTKTNQEVSVQVMGTRVTQSIMLGGDECLIKL